MANDRKLMSPMGVFVCTLSASEADSMERAGKIRKAGKSSYMQNILPEASGSQTSRAQLTGGCRNGRIAGDGGDMHKLAGAHFSGGRLNQRDIERFIGHRVMTERMPVVKVQRLESRVMYFDVTSDAMAAGV